MSDDYNSLPERIAGQFPEIDDEIVMDLSQNNADYQELVNQMEKLKRQYPFISRLRDGVGAISLSEQEHEVLQEFIRLYMRVDDMEREHIYFRGHTDGFAYLKRIGALKTEE